MNNKNHYEVLGVSRDADQATIKKAYRKLARKYHPDVSKQADAEQQFQQLSAAYTVLKNKDKRAEYDEFGAAAADATRQAYQAPPGAGQSYYYSAAGDGPDTGGVDFGDLFESIYGAGSATGAGFQSAGAQPQGRGSNHQGHRQGAGSQRDQHASVLLDLADAFKDTTRELSLSEPVIGPNGELVNQQRRLKVKIPQGIAQGQTMRLKGQGVAGLDGGPRGDLFLEINFAPHSHFQVDGKDLMIELPISPWEAVLGAKVHVPMPDGKRLALSLPQGVSSGKKMRLKGQGIPAKQPGNLMVVLKIVLPASSNEAEKAAYTALQAASDFNPREALEA